MSPINQGDGQRGFSTFREIHDYSLEWRVREQIFMIIPFKLLLGSKYN